MSTSPDEMAFLKAIADNPADETARLAFADWLQEQGDGPRAEFARLSADFLRCLRELGEKRHTLAPEWAEVVDPLFNRVRLVPVSWQHEDGDTVVSAVRVVPGEAVRRRQLLVTLESDRMGEEIVATESGVIVSVLVKAGDEVQFGQPLLAYLSTPVEPPPRSAPPPVIPVREMIALLEDRREQLAAATAEHITRENGRIVAGIQMVFGRQALLRASAQALSRGPAPEGGTSDAQRALAHFDTCIDTLRILLASHGQPTGFAEPPATE